MYCKNCLVPLKNLKDGYYRVPLRNLLKGGYYTTGVYYCRECYLSIKAQRESEFRMKANTHRSIAQQIQLLEQRINRADYQIFINHYSLEHYSVRTDAPYYIKEMVAEMNKLYLQNKNTDLIGGDIDLANAHYFESQIDPQNAETIYWAQKNEKQRREREEEERKRIAAEDERRKKAEEEEQRRKAIEEENRRKAEEAEKARIIEEQKRKEREEAEKKRRIFHENEQAVINGKKSYNGRIITQQELLALAMYSRNMKVIKRLARSKNIVILETLKKNTLVSVKTIDKINKRIQKLNDIKKYGYIGYILKNIENNKDYIECYIESLNPFWMILFYIALLCVGLLLFSALFYLILYICALFG